VTGTQQDFPALLSQLEAIHTWLQIWCEKESLSDPATNRILLIAEELFVNHVNYGAASAASTVRFTVYASEQTILVEMVDSGKPFDPFFSECAPSTSALSGSGGLGLILIRNLATQTQYVHEASHNHTRVWLSR
jgi:anti-sigma regulatory factor (Ser/Thr protein kinase)